MSAVINQSKFNFSFITIMLAIFGWFVIPAAMILVILGVCTIVVHRAFYYLFAYHHGAIPAFGVMGLIFFAGACFAWLSIMGYREYVFKPLLRKRVERENEGWEHC